MRRRYKQRLLISSQGTFSTRVAGDEFLMTLAGSDCAVIKPGDLVLAGPLGIERGKLPSRALPLHAAMYRAHPAVQAIAMATPVNATAFAVTRAQLDTRTIPESYIFLRDVGRIPFEAAYGDPAAFAARCNPEFPISLLENDGVMVLGTTRLGAFDRLEVLESTAEAVINMPAWRCPPDAPDGHRRARPRIPRPKALSAPDPGRSAKKFATGCALWGAPFWRDKNQG